MQSNPSCICLLPHVFSLSRVYFPSSVFPIASVFRLPSFQRCCVCGVVCHGIRTSVHSDSSRQKWRYTSSIGKCAFTGCDSVQSLTLANLPLLESIGGDAFSDCEHLTSVDLSRLPSLHSIGRRAFCGCQSLQSVTLANLPVLESIEEGAFCECVRLTHVDFTNVNLSGLRSLHKIRAGALSRMLTPAH